MSGLGVFRNCRWRCTRKRRQKPGRFYALYDKISREDILAHAHAQCRSNKGAPGVDGQELRGSFIGAWPVSPCVPSWPATPASRPSTSKSCETLRAGLELPANTSCEEVRRIVAAMPIEQLLTAPPANRPGSVATDVPESRCEPLRARAGLPASTPCEEVYRIVAARPIEQPRGASRTTPGPSVSQVGAPGYVVWLSTMFDESAAQREFKRLQSRYPDLLGEQPPFIWRDRTYRIGVGPFATERNTPRLRRRRMSLANAALVSTAPTWLLKYPRR